MPVSRTTTSPSRTMADRIVRWILFGLVAASLIWLISYFYNLILYFVLGVLAAYLLSPLVNFLHGFGLKRTFAIFLTFVIAILVLSVLVYLLVPPIAVQALELSRLLQSGSTIETVAGSIQTFFEKYIPIEPNAVRDSFEQGYSTLFKQQGLMQAISSMANLFTNLFYAILIGPLVTFFVLKDGLKMREAVLRIVPNRYFEIVLQIIEQVENNLGRYFGGLFVQSLSVSVVATVLLWIVGLENALAVGIFAGLANTIPYFGPTVGFIAGCLVGIGQTGDFSLVLGVLIAMAITQVTDNVFLQPFIFSRVARTHPVVILAVVLMGAQIGGILGMLLAIPVLTIVRVIVEQVLWALRNYRIFNVSK